MNERVRRFSHGGIEGMVIRILVDRDHVAGLLPQVADGEFTYPNAQYAIDKGLWEELRKPMQAGFSRHPFTLRSLFVGESLALCRAACQAV